MAAPEQELWEHPKSQEEGTVCPLAGNEEGVRKQGMDCWKMWENAL